MAEWWCLTVGCGDGGDGDWATVDKAAEKHTKTTKHGTTTATTGSVRKRDERGRVSNHKPAKEVPA